MSQIIHGGDWTNDTRLRALHLTNCATVPWNNWTSRYIVYINILLFISLPIHFSSSHIFHLVFATKFLPQLMISINLFTDSQY